ncbi:sigma-54-dependent transcriptional regulator [Lentilitoribacter sp. EG35]|uniref:sigma-54-dependent transcriptional regulator n=1 Tax=Lentilitoribacter sp. EG35 TaxID=3234192 RepID=UPI00345FFE43
MDEIAQHTVLVIDDDREMRDSLEQLLTSSGFKPILLPNAKTAKASIENELPDVVLCDVRMPGITGLELLEQLKPESAAPIVMMSAHGDIPMAVDALQKGAYSFLEKPFDPRRLLNILKNAASMHRLAEREKRLRARLADLTDLDKVLLGESDVIKSLKREILDLADANASVLLVGETGTGKELVARAIHNLGNRSEEPFIAVNCAAIPQSQFEEMIFGVEGSGEQGVEGLLQQANKGTLFLDELKAMPLEFQAKILRVIETGEYHRVGASQQIKSDFRIISTSDEPLEQAAKRGEFRNDLLYRVNTVVLSLPGLRHRPDDIELLFSHFTNRFATIYEVSVPTLTSDDIAVLMSYDWPGNVRELSSVCERRVLASRRGNGSVKSALALDEDLDVPENLRGAVAAFERQLISKALAAHNGRMDAVAEALGISRRTLNEKIVKLDLDKDKAIGQSSR